MPLDSEETSANATIDTATTDNAAPVSLRSRKKAPNGRCNGITALAAKAWATSTGLTCVVCNETHRDWHSLWKHTESHNPTPRDPELLKDCRLPNGLLQCLVCGYKVRGMSRLRRHYFSHSTERPFECNVCHRKYKTTEQLLKHLIRTHLPEDTTYKCDRCNYSTDRKYLAQAHKKGTHSARERCEVCFEQFRKCSLKEHYFLHTGEKRFSCNLCGKKFTYQKTLRHHVEIEHLKRHHECNECGKMFKHSRSLPRHMKIVHESEPSHICCICSKPLKLYNSYVRHMAQVHVGEETEKCPVCGRGFSNKPNMRRHVLVHTEEKRYSCEVCGKAFALKWDVKCHVKTHSDERPFKCDLCGQAYKWKCTLASHMKAKHV